MKYLKKNSARWFGENPIEMIHDFERYLLSSKFHNDTTIQVGDVLDFLSDLKMTIKHNEHE